MLADTVKKRLALVFKVEEIFNIRCFHHGNCYKEPYLLVSGVKILNPIFWKSQSRVGLLAQDRVKYFFVVTVALT